MDYCTALIDLLRPLGVYDLTSGSLSHSELLALGQGLDTAGQELARTERESSPFTACEEGLRRMEQLFAKTPANNSALFRRQALRSLLSMCGDGFTLKDINRAISGCGVTAFVSEKDTFGYVRVTFPDTFGIPDGFDKIREIILDIIPCHLDVEFYFRYLTWQECHDHGYTWKILEDRQYTCYDFQIAI